MFPNGNSGRRRHRRDPLRPATGDYRDANQEGTRKTYEDEFIEIYNTGPDTVSLMGWRLGDDDTSLASLFTFPDSTKLPPGDRLLLFGGGTPTGFSVPAFADDGRIGNGLTNSGDVLLLLNAAGDNRRYGIVSLLAQ